MPDRFLPSRVLGDFFERECDFDQAFELLVYLDVFMNVRKIPCLQSFHIALNDEDFLLLQFLLQPLFELRSEPSRCLHIRRNHAIDDNFITIGDTSYRPKTLVGLGKEGEAAELSVNCTPASRSFFAASSLTT